MTTVASGGGATVTETDSYVNGQNSYHSQISVSGAAGGSQLYHAGDCYLAGSDIGYGAQDSGPTILCTQNANNSPPGRYIGFVARTAGANFLETFYNSVWSATDGGAAFPNRSSRRPRCRTTVPGSATA